MCHLSLGVWTNILFVCLFVCLFACFCIYIYIYIYIFFYIFFFFFGFAMLLIGHDLHHNYGLCVFSV
jgi:hypothetical protein